MHLPGSKVVPILLMLCIFTGCPAAVIGEQPFTVTRNVVYGQGYVDPDDDGLYTLKNLQLDIYRPEAGNSARLPAIIQVHGGGFTEGSKENENLVDYAEYLASRGYAVFNINYRLTRDRPPSPPGWNVTNLTRTTHAAMVDVRAAVRFVRANAAAYGVNPERIGLLGESAGAIAAVSTAIADPPLFSNDGETFPQPAANNIDTASTVQAYAHFWGNADHVLIEMDRDDPPVMLVHGTDDDQFGTPFAAAERFHGLLELVDIPHEFYQAEGFGHGAWDYRENLKLVRTLTREFFDEHLMGISKALIEGRTAAEAEDER